MKGLFFTLVIIVIYASAAMAGFDESMVLYLPFDEGSGDLAKDLSNYQNNGTLKGPKWVNGKYGSALSFNGASDFVEVPFSDSLNIDPSKSLTITVWVNVSNPDFTWRAIVVKGSSAWDWGIYRSDRSGFMMGLNNLHELYSTMQAAKDTWYYVAGVYDDSNWYMYVDGELDVKKEKGARITTSKDGLSVGKKGTANMNFFAGIIDEVRIWNRALSENEIKANMDKGREQLLIAVFPNNDKLAMTWGAIKSD